MSMDDERRRRARQIAKARYGFWWHLPIYVIVNLALLAVWYYTVLGSLGQFFPFSSGG